MIRDLEADLPRVWGRVISSIFIGGGTPSLFSAQSYRELFSAIHARLQIRPDAEVTLEVNPGAIEHHQLAGYRQAGINRLSLGAQSFDDEMLAKIGRIHCADETRAAVLEARQAGFDRINLDIMFGLPGQALQQAMDDLNAALALETEHLSWYQLTLEPDTAFYKRPPVLPDHDALWEIQQAGHDLLNQNGFVQYEVSAWCRDATFSQHNLNYWQFGDYLGIGAGAHAKITDAGLGRVQRFAKIKSPRAYLQAANSAAFIETQQKLDTHDLLFEFCLNALRLSQGVETALFQQRCGLPVSELKRALQTALSSGHLLMHNGTIRCSEEGKYFLNEILQQLLP